VLRVAHGHVYIHTYIHIYIHTYIHTSYTYTHAQTHYFMTYTCNRHYATLKNFYTFFFFFFSPPLPLSFNNNLHSPNNHEIFNKRISIGNDYKEVLHLQLGGKILYIPRRVVSTGTSGTRHFFCLFFSTRSDLPSRRILSRSRSSSEPRDFQREARIIAIS